MSPPNPTPNTETNSTPPGDNRRRRSKRDTSPDATSRLERKRLSDRRSQRAMREKTKQRIAELESALQALLATNVNRELKEKIAENQALKEEVVRLRARLERISRLCFTDSEGGRSNGSARCRDASADEKSLENKENGNQGIEVFSRNKKRKTSRSQNAPVFPCPQETSASLRSSTNSPEEGDELGENDYQFTDFNPANTINPLTSSLDGSISFGDDAFWSVIQSGSHFDTFPASPTAQDTTGQTHDDIQLGHNGRLVNCSNDNTNLFNIDFADLTTSQPVITDTPQSASSVSALVGPSHENGISSPENLEMTLAPGLRPMWNIGASSMLSKKTPGSIFEQMVRNALEKYKGLPKERLDIILPAAPCMAPFFSSMGCNSPLSKGLFDQMRVGSTWPDPANFIGAYWCLHSLLRYFLRPVVEEIPYIPPYMLPPSLPVNRPVSCWDFLPWQPIRERVVANQPQDVESSSKLEVFFGSNTTLCWPYSLNEAITFAPPADTVFGSTGPYTIAGCSGCKCSAPQLTDRFKLHLTRSQAWKLKSGSPQIVQKYPELRTLMI